MSSDQDGDTSGEGVPNVIVIDNGSYKCKAGMAGEDLPRAVFPACVGRSRGEAKEGSKCHDPYIGDDATSKRGVLDLTYPVEKGIITNWDDMEMLWHHTFYKELRRVPEEYKVLITEPPDNLYTNREKTAQIMFETFGVPGFYLAIQQVMSLYASGRVTGIVADIGYDATTVLAVKDGHPYAFPLGNKIEVGGRQVTKYLTEKLNKTDVTFANYGSSVGQQEIARDVKEKRCYVAFNFDDENEMFSDRENKTYELPDGSNITLGNLMYKAPEILLQPAYIDLNRKGVADSILEVINKRVEKDIRSTMYSNIVLSGGSSLFPGLRERVEADVYDIAPKLINQTETVVKVEKAKLAAAEQQYSAWIGASIFSAFSTFEQTCITKQEYNETGPKIVQRKCK